MIQDRRDTITLTGLRATGFHGVFEHERHHGQEFVVDVTLYTDNRPAGASDDLGDTLDYGAVADLVVQEITGGPYQLIERLAEVIAARILQDVPAQAVDVVVHKPYAPIEVQFRDVSVGIHRERGQA